MHSRRALLYVPATDLKKTAKAAGLKADSVCLDLEDGVSLNRKADARAIGVEALASSTINSMIIGPLKPACSRRSRRRPMSRSPVPNGRWSLP